MPLSPEDIRNQSIRTYKQWAEQWRRQAAAARMWPMKTMEELRNIGIGRAILCIGNGYSFEEEIETIQQHWRNVDIICCDKALGHLLSRGIKPTYCLVADANVNYEKYLKPWEGQCEETILLSNVCANPQWADHGNWKDRFFFVVEDVLNSQKEFMAISGCPNTIAAGTNVSNLLVIAVTQCGSQGRNNFMGYDKVLLIGFDYCWAPDGKYYAFDEDGGGKTNYMRHSYLRDPRGLPTWSSTNLIFSAKWLDSYVSAFKLPVVQCSKRSVYGAPKRGILSEQMQYSYRPENRESVKRLMELHHLVTKQKMEYEAQIQGMAREHYYAFLRSV